MVSMFGSFLGECIRHTYGGEWVLDSEQGWTLEITPDVAIYPFNKVRKHLSQEEGDSVYGLFSALGPIIEVQPNKVLPRVEEASVALPPEKTASAKGAVRTPWWKFW